MRYPSPSSREIGHQTGIKDNVCMEAGGRARVRKKKKMPGYLFCSYCFQFLPLPVVFLFPFFSGRTV